MRKQPGEKITTSEGFEVTFISIDYHTSYFSSHNYEMCFFPNNRCSRDDVEMPWFKYSRNYTYAVYDTKKDSTAQYAYDVMYEIITTLFRLIATYEVRTESVGIKRKVFNHDVLTKAIEFERKSLDNILFGLYVKL